MPFRSHAQRRLFYAKGKKGEIPMETVREWEKETKKKSLPERLEKKASESGLSGFERAFEDSCFVMRREERYSKQT